MKKHKLKTKIKTPEEMEADYQIGLKLIKAGYIRAYWGDLKHTLPEPPRRKQ